MPRLESGYVAGLLLTGSVGIDYALMSR